MDNWTWGLSLIAVTMAMHVTGVMLLVSVLHGLRVRLAKRGVGLPHVVGIMAVAFTAIGLLLAVLHGVEAGLWAAAYLWLGAVESPWAAILYSIDSMATRGGSGLILPARWQMLGALEGADGMLLFGISTALIFTVMLLYFQNLVFFEGPGGSPKTR